jgi:uncharacterized protein (UPF0147 family)
MGKIDERDGLDGMSLPYATSADLRGRQSVRATFRLTEKAIEAISIVAVHLGIKQKSLFDHLIEDKQTLNAIAREAGSFEFKRRERVQKTFVLSRKTLSLLERISGDFNTPRDVLVEYSILRLLPVIRQEQEKHKKRKDFLGEIKKQLNQGQKLLETAGKVLGEDDPVFNKLTTAVAVWESTHHDIESFIERCKIIENFKPDILEAIFKTSRE